MPASTLDGWMDGAGSRSWIFHGKKWIRTTGKWETLPQWSPRESSYSCQRGWNFNLGYSANTLPLLFFQNLSFSWMPPLQWDKLGQHFKSELTGLEMLENSEKTEFFHLKPIFTLHPFVLWFVAVPSPLPSRAGWDAQARVCLHCRHLSELPGWMLSICRDLPPSVQPSPADSLQRSCQNQDHREFRMLLFPPVLFLLLKFCGPSAPTGSLWQLTTCFSP